MAADPIDPDAPDEGVRTEGQSGASGSSTTNEGAKTEAGGRLLFDASDYDDPKLALPMIDGLGVDEIELAFSCTIKLDRSSPDDCATYRKLSDGHSLTLRVEARHAGTTGKVKTKTDETEVTVGQKILKVDTVYLLTAEEL